MTTQAEAEPHRRAMRRRRHPPRAARDDHEAVVAGLPVLQIADENVEAVAGALAEVLLAALEREGVEAAS